MDKTVAKFISFLTLVPVVALFVINILFQYDSSFFGEGYTWYAVSLLCLVIIPILAYPLKRVLPGYKEGGREEERKLAFITGVFGQVFGFILSLLFNAPKGVRFLFTSYLVAGILLTVSNLKTPYRASGHACGVAGPIAILVHVIGKKLLMGFLLMPLVFWARLKLKRHSIKELMFGTAVGVCATVIAIAAFRW